MVQTFQKRAYAGRARVAELTSSLGALVLGMGLGILLSKWLADVGIWILLGGAVAHAWGMYDKNRLEQSAGAPDVWWHVYAYWLCWLVLGVGALVLSLRVLV